MKSVLNKINVLFLLSIFYQGIELNRVKIINPSLNQTIIDFIDNNKHELSNESDFLLVGFYSSDSISSYELRLAFVKKSEYKDLELDFEPYGYTKYKNTEIIFSGIRDSSFMKLENTKFKFSYLLKKKNKVYEIGEIPPPPVAFEPTVWVYYYNFEDNKFELLSVGKHGF
jgi:hypothetical protein